MSAPRRPRRPHSAIQTTFAQMRRREAPQRPRDGAWPAPVHEAQAIVDALRKMLANEQQDQVEHGIRRVAQRIEH
jgi:hypothetical protein